jgi:hypothetical protein
MSDLYSCPWGCGEMIEVDDPYPEKVVTCPRCDRECRLTKHTETDGTTWLDLRTYEP